MPHDSTTESDRDWVSQAKSGDLESLRRLVERYQTPVFRIHYQFVNDYHLAQDLTQETFLRAFRHLRRFDPGKGAFSAWIYAIARNLSLSALRKRSLPGKLEEGVEPIDTESPRHLMHRREQLHRLDRALGALAEPFKAAFVLAEIEEMPLAQVAEIEGVPIGTIKSRISRARERLREALKKEEEVDES